MDLRNLISRNDDEDAATKLRMEKDNAADTTLLPKVAITSDSMKTKLQPKLSIHNLMNNDEASKKPAKPELASIVTNKNDLPRVPGAEIKKRSSITTITNEEDVDMEGHKTPNVARRQSSSTSVTPGGSVDLVEVKKEKERMYLDGEAKRKSKPKRSFTIEEEIQNLKKLQEKEAEEKVHYKPRRYSEKPSWAKDYIPKLFKGLHHSMLSLSNPTRLTVPSITGSIPRNDFNKLVTEWIWANIQGVKQDFVDIPHMESFLELELKVGTIWDKVKDRRLQLPVNSECIVAQEFIHQDCFFKSGITPKNFGDIKNYFEKLSQDAQSRKKKDKFIVESSHNVDLIAQERKRNDKLVTGRVTLDVKTKRRVASIEKQRVSDLFIYLPNSLFDLRLSMSLEIPREMNDAAFETFKHRVSMERDKDRSSYIHPATATRIDLTKIKENQVTKYELELEINTPELLRSMNMVSDDPLYYVDLIQAFLDNGRIVTRQLKLTYITNDHTSKSYGLPKFNSPSSDGIFLSVVIPCYNEKNRLRSMLVEALEFLNDTYPNRYEILIIDDGSKDGTAEYALKLADEFKVDPHVMRAVQFVKNRGKGGAVCHGMQVARGEYVIFADADGASKFSDTRTMISAIQELDGMEPERKAAIAVGSRAHMVNTDAVVKRSFIRNLLMYGLHTLVYLFGIRDIKDTQCGFKLFNKLSVRNICPYMHTEGWIFDVEMMILAERQSISLKEVPISWHEVQGSKMALARDSINMGIDLVVTRMAYVLGIYADGNQKNRKVE
ncbi:hypothetical protein FOA43_003946 [Brettanomyces nanus]|uniref:Polynucleotide 5'-phosphatase n=1 Tax=Eeniella nana TaxID=13502 RepID=A0A875S5H4_EENNA|nr:uncharacterized protein FOA43_003946 [Brettanomyces nanus]QPG76556.1 hypothetical protein FOA43_003946 [Brettanomyces nanus]